MNFNKIIGYVLLAAGLVMIGWSLFQSYLIFTDRAAPPVIFKEQKKTSVDDNGQQQQQFEKALEQQLSSLLPSDIITKTFNLLIWSVLAGIFIFGGSQIASIGVRMLHE